MGREEYQEQRREKLTAERQNQILEAAIRVFSRKGFHAATTAEIAREAGVAEGTLFHYFRTKKDILLGLAGPYALEGVTQTLTAMEDKSPEEMLTAFLGQEHEFVQRNTDVLRLLFYEAQFHEELRLKFLDDIASQGIRLLRQDFEERQKRGEFRQDLSPDVAVNSLVGMFAFLVAWQHLLGRDQYPDMGSADVVRQLVTIFLEGAKPR